MFLGTIGLFFTLLFLFIRFLPMISISEMRTLLPEARVQPTTGRATRGALMATYPGLYGLLAEFDDADGAGRGRPRGSPGRLHDEWTPTRRSRSRGWRRRWASGARGCRCWSCSAASLGALSAASALQYYCAGHQLPAQRRRPAAQQLADVHPGHVRADDPASRRWRRSSACWR